MKVVWRSLYYFNPSTMTPAGWGHSLLLGRVKWLLKWTFEDLSTDQISHLIKYLQKQHLFPDVDRFTNSNARTLILVDGLEAYEVASVMILLPFALACVQPPVSGMVLQAWRLQCVLAVNYYRRSFTNAQIVAHSRDYGYYISAVNRAFLHNRSRTLANKIKFHDPLHDAMFIIFYRTFLIVNELAKEVVHQHPKQTSHNNRAIEQQMLEKVSTESKKEDNDANYFW
jgi:hypothetical protein